MALPRGGFVLNLAGAYIDESGTHDGAPVIGVGGYLFEAGRAASFNDEMGRLFDQYRIPYFHASEIIGGVFKEGGSGKFDHLKPRDRDIIARAFIESVKKHSSFGFGATVCEADYNRITKPHGSLMPGAYAFLLFQCATLVRKWIDRSGFGGRVFYFIEDGAKEKSDAEGYLDTQLFKTQRRKDFFRYHGRAFVPKDHSPAINSADLLIYRWYSHLSKQNTPGYSPRKDLVALLRPHDMVSDWAGELLSQLEQIILEYRAELDAAT